MNNTNNILKINKLSIGYASKWKKNALFENISLNAREGEIIALIGENGIGKSTLLRTLVNLQIPLAGEINVYNKPYAQYNRNEWAQIISYVPTHKTQLNYLTVKEFVSYGRYPYTNLLSGFSNEDKNIINNSIKETGITHLANKNINEISDGERQKANIARTLTQDTKIIILDEPTAFLDLPNKYETIKVLNQISKTNNKTIIFSTHDLNIALHYADKIWLMTKNEIIEGSPEDLILNHSIEKVFHNPNLKFDQKTGEFKIQQTHKQTISLSYDNSQTGIWTKKALERNGFKTDSSLSKELQIEILLKNNKTQWILKNKSKNYIFNSIYDLILQLNNLIK